MAEDTQSIGTGACPPAPEQPEVVGDLICQIEENRYGIVLREVVEDDEYRFDVVWDDGAHELIACHDTIWVSAAVR